MNNTRKKEKTVGKRMEAWFSTGYLIFVFLAAAIFFLYSSKSTVFVLFGLLSLILGSGDSFHLVPRILIALKGPSKKLEWWSGLGLMVSSITMTGFYVLLFYIWKLIFRDTPYPPYFPFLIWASALLRIILCLFPQNRWFSPEGNKTWSLLRNAPFLITGACVAILFFLSDNLYGYGLWQMGIAIIISFACYFPVVLYAKTYPAVGMLMIPKTIAYIWMIGLGLSLIGMI